jgi:DNA repair and recombination protein RAD52
MVTSDPENQGRPYLRPIRLFSPSEESAIKAKLEAPIPAEGIAYRSSSGGQVAYIEGWRAFNYANDIFGFNGWSSEILNFTTDFMDEESGKVSVGISCTVRITLKDGTFHEVSKSYTTSFV